MSELAFSGLGQNPSTATPPCVNDADAVPGGSSSGAAASVAFGLAACGIGTDTGGSVRIPSAWNDLVGLKTTAGRVSLEGVVPLCAQFDTVGPLADRSRMRRSCWRRWRAAKPPICAARRCKACGLAALQTVALEDVREAPLAAYASAVERLEAAGAVVDKIEVPEVAEAMPLSGALFTSEAYGTGRDVIEATPDKMFAPKSWSGSGRARTVSAADYVAAWPKLDALRAQWHARAAGYDAVIMPTAPILPPDLARLLSDEDYYVTENLLALRNTRIGNLMGLSAVTPAHGRAQLRDHAVWHTLCRSGAFAAGGGSRGGVGQV